MDDALKKRLMLGATGAFPLGNLNPTDEGELRLAISSTTDGLVRLDFGKPVAWFAMTKNGAKEMAALLIKHADDGVAE